MAYPALDAEIVASSFLVPHFDVVHLREPQQFFNRSVVAAFIGVTLINEALALSISVENGGVLPEIVRITGILGIAFASFGVDEDRSRQRNLLDAVEWIVGKEGPLLGTDAKRAQAVTARAVSAGDLRVCGVSVTRRRFARSLRRSIRNSSSSILIAIVTCLASLAVSNFRRFHSEATIDSNLKR